MRQIGESERSPSGGRHWERGGLPIDTVSAANNTDWLRKCGLELWESSEGKNGDDQCWKLLPEKRQIPWPTVDIV